MHNEKPTYRAETDDGESSSTTSSSSRSSFGNGPAFRPVLPVEVRPAAESPALPRRVDLEGILFDRKRVISHLDEKARAEKKAKSSEEDSDDSSSTSTKKVETAGPQTAEAAPVPRTHAPEAASLHTVAGQEAQQDAEPSESEKTEIASDDQAVSGGDEKTPAVFTYPEVPASLQQAESHLPPLGEVRSPEQYVPSVAEYHEEPDPIAGHVPTTSPHHSLVPPRQPVAPFEHAAFDPMPPTAEAAPEWSANDEDETPVPLPTPPANPVSSYNTVSTPATYYNQLGNTPPPTTAIGGNTPPPMGPPPTHSFGANPNMFPPIPNPNNPNLYPPSGGNTVASPNVAAPAPSSQVIEQRRKGNPWPYVAVLAERFARRRADKKLEGRLGDRIDGQDKTQKSVQASQRRMERQQEQMSAFQARQEADARRNRTAETWGTAATVTAASQGGESVHATAFGQQAELRPMTPIQNTAEQQLLENAGPIELAPHQRVEHSAWHNIVVNERGQEVSGAINYGEGFKRERQQEIIPDRVAAGAVPGSGGGAGGSTAGAGNASSYVQMGVPYGYGQDGMHQSALPSGMTTPGLPQGQPTYVDPQHQLPQHTQKRTNAVMPGPVFWVMALLIVLAFFAAALI